MFENIDELLQKVGEEMIRCSQDYNWLELYYTIQLEGEGVTKSTFKYMDENGDIKDVDFFGKDCKLSNYFESIYQTMTKDTDKHKWNRAKATLTSDNKLNIKYEWDQELADEIAEYAKKYPGTITLEEAMESIEKITWKRSMVAIK